SVALRHLVRFADGPQRPIEPQRTTQATGTWRRACHRKPFLVNRVRLPGVDEDVAVAIAGARFLERDALVPAVHAPDRIGLNRKGEVLMHADFAPPDPRAVRVGAFERCDTLHL